MDEMCRSNILQRDNQKFARKLNKNLVKIAKERSDMVRFVIGFLIKIMFLCRLKTMTIFGQRKLDEK